MGLEPIIGLGSFSDYITVVGQYATLKFNPKVIVGNHPSLQCFYVLAYKNVDLPSDIFLYNYPPCGYNYAKFFLYAKSPWLYAKYTMYAKNAAIIMQKRHRPSPHQLDYII